MSRPVPFGFKMAWLAVRSDSPDHVIEVLGIEGASASSWEEGVGAVYASTSMTSHPVFVTPRLDSWVLAASPAYFDEVSDADPERIARFVSGVAQSFGAEVQFFATHRVVEGHAWAAADADGLKRAYFYLGEADECLLDRGTRTPFEDGLACLKADATDVVDESTVMSVADAWSLDPTQLEERHADVGPGMLGAIANLVAEPPDEHRSHSTVKPWWKLW